MAWPGVIVRRFAREDLPRIARLNQRLAAGGVDLEVFPEGDEQRPGPIAARLFVAVNEDEVRGAVWLHEHEFSSGGETVRAGWAKYPVSESLIDPSHGGVAAALVIGLLREQPHLMALGMGGQGHAYARLLNAMRWKGMDVPFFTRPLNPRRVLRGLAALRHSRARRLAMDAAAVSGLGWLGARALDLALRRHVPSLRGVTATVEPRFGSWATETWEAARANYGLVARRDAEMLNRMFGDSLPIDRLRIRRNGVDIGWAVVLHRDFTRDASPNFGCLKVALVADGFCRDEDVGAVLGATDRHVMTTASDIAIANQLHPLWRTGLRKLGFVAGPSQFALFVSPKLRSSFDGSNPARQPHVNRGDCDGPWFA